MPVSNMNRWNQRFTVSPSKDNPRLHEFYREYFDKPSGRKFFNALPPSRQRLLDPPSLRSTLGFDFQRMPVSSRAVSRKGRKREGLWDNRFSVMWSKDNQHLHRAEREYFDRRKDVELRRDLMTGKDLPKLYKASTYRSLRSTASKRSLESAARETWGPSP